MKKLVSLLEAILLMVMAFPLTALAGQEGTQIISPVFCIPFAGLLLCVAIMPLVKAEWWESHQPHAVVFWSVLFVIPFAIFFGAGEATEKVLECIIDDYLTFIVLLFGLFCVAGNITLEGDLAGSPRINVGVALNLGMVYPVVCCVFGVNVRLNAGCAGFVKVGAAVSVAAASFEALFSAGCAL